MTIIKVSVNGKLLPKKKVEETAVPLTPGSNERGMRVEYVTSRRTKNVVNVVLLLLALLVLASGVIGGYYMYKFMSNRHHMEKVTIEVEELPRPQPIAHQTNSPASQVKPYAVSYTMVEEIDIRVEEELERIEVPKFDECRSSIIMHDFQMNYTVIVDNEDQECFIMPLDREKMKPPKSFVELLAKYQAGYYMPKVDVVRRDFQVVMPKLRDLTFAGEPISQECLGMDSYLLEKKTDVPVVRIEEVHLEIIKTYGYSDLEHLIKDQIHK